MRGSAFPFAWWKPFSRVPSRSWIFPFAWTRLASCFWLCLRVLRRGPPRRPVAVLSILRACLFLRHQCAHWNGVLGPLRTDAKRNSPTKPRDTEIVPKGMTTDSRLLATALFVPAFLRVLTWHTLCVLLNPVFTIMFWWLRFFRNGYVLWCSRLLIGRRRRVSRHLRFLSARLGRHAGCLRRRCSRGDCKSYRDNELFHCSILITAR